MQLQNRNFFIFDSVLKLIVFNSGTKWSDMLDFHVKSLSFCFDIDRTQIVDGLNKSVL